MKKEADHRAFTLVELLVVIAIIALLMALFVPNMTGALRRARTYQCQRNLEHIGRAVMNRRAAVGDDRDDQLIAGAWPGSLVPYLENIVSITICPEDADPAAGGFSEDLPVQIAVSPPGTWAGISHYLDLVAGPMCRKLSVEQFDAWYPNAQVGVDSTPPTYVEGADPSTYYFTLRGRTPPTWI